MQAYLFAAPVQPRLAKREDPALYFAIVLLRKMGHRVIRVGRHDHLIDGQRITSAELLARAGA